MQLHSLLIIVAAALFTTLISSVNAHSHSSAYPPVRHYDFVNARRTGSGSGDGLPVALDIKAFNHSYTLHLERNNHLIVPQQSRIIIHDEDTGIPHSRNYRPHAFHGHVVVHPFKGGRPIKVGWARLVFQSDPLTTSDQDLEFEGAFTHAALGGIHHISTISSYGLARRDGLDTLVTSPLSRPSLHRRAKMIIFRDIDSVNGDGGHDSHAHSLHRRSMMGSTSASSPFSGLFDGHFNEFPITHPPLEPRSFVEAVNGTSSSSSSGSSHYAASSEKVHSCGLGQPHNMDSVKQGVLDYLATLDNQQLQTHNLHRRQSGSGSASCSPSQLTILPMSVVADCTYVAAKGSASSALHQIIVNWNSASAVYESTFNIRLALVEVRILQACGNNAGQTLVFNQPCSEQYNVNNRLSDFSAWRGTLSDQVGLYHLMTKCNTGPSVGIAWVGQLCQNKATTQADGQMVSGTGLSTIVPTEWKVVAHEIGHNFGAIHDCISLNCPATCTSSSDPSQCSCCPCGQGGGCDCKGLYLMHPTDNSALDQFSPCSISMMCSGMSKASCLVPASKFTASVVTENQCGNGVVEGNEQCDCGQECDKDNCCNGATCQFVQGAVCDDLNDMCCTSCQLRPKGTICRQVSGTCAFNSTCDGKVASCPATIVLPDGQGCSSSLASGTTCASGVCTSRDLQCRSTISSSNATQYVKQCSGQSSSCTLSCQNAAGQCYSLNGYFIDGTTCGNGGKCYNGACTGLSFMDQIKSWFANFPQIAIPVTVGIVLVVLVLISCCCRCFSRRRQQRRGAATKFSRGKFAGSSSPQMPAQHKFLENSSSGISRVPLAAFHPQHYRETASGGVAPMSAPAAEQHELVGYPVQFGSPQRMVTSAPGVYTESYDQQQQPYYGKWRVPSA